MAKKPTVPLKITAHLADGRINSADGIIMFDAILYHAWFRRHAPHVLRGEGDTFDGYFGLPLRQLPGNRWAASKGVYEQIGQSVEHINKRPDFFAGGKISRLEMDKGIISSAVGLYRSYRIPSVIRTVKDGIITFWAMGHAEEVQSLLDEMVAVGKKSAIGYGVVARWNVTECAEDYSLWHPEHGLMRPIPVEEAGGMDLQDYPIMQYGVKPPYWKAKNARLCHVPVGR